MDPDRREIGRFAEVHRGLLAAACSAAGLAAEPPSLAARTADAVEMVLGPVEPGDERVRTLLARLHLADLALAAAAEGGDGRAAAAVDALAPAAARRNPARLSAYRATVALADWLEIGRAPRAEPAAPPPPGATGAGGARALAALPPSLRLGLALASGLGVDIPRAALVAAASRRALTRAAASPAGAAAAAALALGPPPSACPDENVLLAWLRRFPELASGPLVEHLCRCPACLATVAAAAARLQPGRPGATWRRTSGLVALAAGSAFAAWWLGSPATVAPPPDAAHRAEPSGPSPIPAAALATPTAAEPAPTAAAPPPPEEPRPRRAAPLRGAEPAPSPPAPAVVAPLAGVDPGPQPATDPPARTAFAELALRRAPGDSRAARTMNQALDRYRPGGERALLNVLTRTLLLEPDLAEGHFDAALIAERLADRRRARAHWLRYLELAPQAPDNWLVRERLRR